MNNNFNETLIDVLESQLTDKKEKISFIFLSETESKITFGQLVSDAKRIASGLAAKTPKGGRVLLLCPPGMEYIKLLFACFFANVIAVPLYPPRPKERTDRISKVVSDCKSSCALTSSALKSSLIDSFAADGNQNIEIFDGAELMSDEGLLRDMPNLDDIAFIQYTSGSTGDPKGVVVSHRNVVANLEALKYNSNASHNDVFANWLPLFHDLGLVTAVLLPAYLGATSVLMAPTRFIQSPVRWLEAITQYKATVGGAPNFAYEHCIDAINNGHLANLDLSSWRIAYNAAEPINEQTLSNFHDKFAVCGFNYESFFPAYGMAEATVFISGGSASKFNIAEAYDEATLLKNKATKATENLSSKTLVNCCEVAPSHHLIVVDTETHSILPDCEVGEIWVAGPSIAPGYWGREELSQEVFQAYSACGNGPYLKTGDLGFVSDGKVVVTGRLKDVLITKGQNYYPQDIECVSWSSHDGLLKTAAAFQTQQSSEASIVVLQEVHPRWRKKIDCKDVSNQIKHAIAQAFGLVAEVVLVKHGQLPKTSSGKIQRALAKQKFESTKLEVLMETSHDMPEHNLLTVSDPKHDYLQKIEKVLGRQISSLSLSLYENGGDSLDAAKVISALNESFELALELESLLNCDSLDNFLDHVIAVNESKLSAAPAQSIEQITEQNNEPCLASFAQKRIWLQCQLPEQAKTMSIPVELTLTGELDTEAFQQAINLLVKQHAILTTSYHLIDSEIMQKVNSDCQYLVEIIDLSNGGEGTAYNQLSALRKEVFEHQFSLDVAPIFILKLAKVGPAKYHLLFNIHHIAADAWSLKLFLSQLSDFYNALSAGKQASAPLQLSSYRTYSQGQHSPKYATQMEVNTQFWRQELDRIPSRISLPFDKKAPIKQSFNGAKVSRPLEQSLLDNLNALSKSNNTTLFVTALSVFQILLSRLSGQKDIVIGTDVANRAGGLVNEVMGFFVNQLVIRKQMDEEANFIEHLRANRQILHKALKHQDMPFEQLVDSLELIREQQHSPIFQVKFLLNKSVSNEMNLNGIDTAMADRRIQLAQYDLTLCLEENQENQYSVDLHFNTDLFEHESVIRMLDDYLSLLFDVADMAEKKVAALCLASTQNAEYQGLHRGQELDLLSLGNGIVPVIEKMAAEHPQNIALVDKSSQCRYSEVNEQANQLAHFLADIGNGEGSFVGVHIKNSALQAKVLLAVMKTGACFVPLDTTYPINRLKHIVADSHCDLIVTEDAKHELFSDYLGALVEIEATLSIVHDEPTENLNTVCDGDAPCYLLYTSGSTGQPKGVQVSHSNFLNLNSWYQEFTQMEVGSVVLQPIPIGFDASLKNIFSPLMSGARVVIPDLSIFEPSTIVELISQQQVEIINCVPSFIYPVIHHAEKNEFCELKSLKVLALGAEKIDASQLTSWMLSTVCQCSVANIYGPTECTDISVACVLDKELLLNPDVVNLPIGKPIQNATVYVLNEELKSCPINVEGELFIAGSGVSAGYKNLLQINKQKFLDIPAVSSEKLFRTGDIVKWNNNRELVFVGRKDEQLKINGIRIEVSEIEQALTKVTQLQAVKVLQKNGELVAFIHCTNLVPPNETEVRGRLLDHLVRSCIPKHYVFLQQWPKLPNGKVDVNALLDISIQMDDAPTDLLAPRSSKEEKMVQIWREVFSQSAIGINSNFFELGGDSIHAVKVVAQAEKAGVLFTVADLFEHSTIAELSKKVTEQELQEEDEEVSFEMLSEDDIAALGSMEDIQQ
ncbi:amino acid adenylation domain-containing protein [Pseudoalteromonas sp. 2CM41L]|uniref:non-ribosomal peptide synthetase n=1 Tax=Pseudoalteromonas sp. 2CM41L TaxID=2929857 RepID=UPI0020BFB9D7|nr:amino acid adenylation domain-containing protein [Pseudoalteromonas sp. 2CM41L]